MSSITSHVLVPLSRPEPLGGYAGRHRAPEPTVEIHRPVGEVTCDRRPYDLAQWEGETRRLTPSPSELSQIRAAVGAL